MHTSMGREIEPSTRAGVKSQPTIFGGVPQSTPLHPRQRRMLISCWRECWESCKSRRVSALFLDTPMAGA